MGDGPAGSRNEDVEGTSRSGGHRFWHIQAKTCEGNACSRYLGVKWSAGAVNAFGQILGEGEMNSPRESVDGLDLDLEESATASLDRLRVVEERQREIG